MKEKIASILKKLPVLFQGGFVSLSGMKGPEFAPFLTQAFKEGSDFPTAVNAIFKAAIAIGAILAVLQLARAGFMYMGGESWGTKEKAKQIMREAVMGILLLLGIWLILFQINENILDLNVLKRMKPLEKSSINQQGGGLSGAGGTGESASLSPRRAGSVEVCFPNIENCD